MNHKALLRRIFENGDAIASPVPGEAPSSVSMSPVLTEPENNPGQDIYSLYPDLSNIDITSACSLAEYFAQMCEDERTNAEMEQKAQMVPSASKVDTPDEF